MDRRTKFRQNLHPLYLVKYDTLCALLPAHWQPYQGYRTFREQDALYAQGRASPGKVVTQARGGESPHCYGCATDWILWDIHGEPIWIGASDPAWKEYISALESCGLSPGIDFGDIDHNELHIKCTWPVVKQVFEDTGLDDAMHFIGRMVLK